MSHDATNSNLAAGDSAGLCPAQSVPRATRLVLSAVLLAASAGLLFVSLGHYAFWDDEADTAIYARGIWDTGDTTAIVGHNICAYRFGGLLSNLKNRSTPPLQYLVVAPFYGLAGYDTFWLRFPMAACGFASVLLVIGWLWRSAASLVFWLVFGVALLGNVSFFLYLRQCRYYALAMLASLVIVYLYVNFRGWRSLAWHSPGFARPVGFAVSQLLRLVCRPGDRLFPLAA